MPTAEINMTPLVDVMLVLLIIFIITAPLMTHSVQGRSAACRQHANSGEADDTAGQYHADNAIFVGAEAVDRNILENRFREAVARMPMSKCTSRPTARRATKPSPRR
jgi:biopolymer transport protein ExbD